MNNLLIPEELTPLYYTPAYSLLEEHERERYYFWHGLYFHEQIIFFEQEMICPSLQAIALSCGPDYHQDLLHQFIQEENVHSSMFHDFLKTRAVEYQDSPYYFIGNQHQGLLQAMVRRPKMFPLFIWLILLLEERALYSGKVFLEHSHHLQPDVISIQRRHLADEINHLRWDELFIESLWPTIPHWWRQINIRILNHLLREFIITPKRAALAVVDRFVDDCPRMKEKTAFLKKNLFNLRHQEGFCRSIFTISTSSKTLRLMKRYSEWDEFCDYWLNDNKGKLNERCAA
jgi:hypothetical protein